MPEMPRMREVPQAPEMHLTLVYWAAYVLTTKSINRHGVPPTILAMSDGRWHHYVQKSNTYHVSELFKRWVRQMQCLIISPGGDYQHFLQEAIPFLSEMILEFQNARRDGCSTTNGWHQLRRGMNERTGMFAQCHLMMILVAKMLDHCCVQKCLAVSQGDALFDSFLRLFHDFFTRFYPSDKKEILYKTIYRLIDTYQDMKDSSLRQIVGEVIRVQKLKQQMWRSPMTDDERHVVVEMLSKARIHYFDKWHLCSAFLVEKNLPEQVIHKIKKLVFTL